MAAHDAFLAYAAKNPETVQFVLNAVGTDEGRVLHTRSKTQSYCLGGQEIDRVSREYTCHFGGHEEVDDAVGFVDPTDREEAIEVALAALTGCINGSISTSAAQSGVEIDALETTVTEVRGESPAECGILTVIWGSTVPYAKGLLHVRHDGVTVSWSSTNNRGG